MLEQTYAQQRLGLTARWTAGVRAQESRRPDRLFDDRWAAVLAGLDGKEWGEHQSADNGISIVVRTRFFDDWLERVTGQYRLEQVVLMAAGLDARAFRLDWPAQTRLFELDQPQVLTYKEQVLAAAGAQPACERKTIMVDLTHSWREALAQAGFDSGRPSAWLLEGFLEYLPNAQITRILDEITSQAAPTSRLGFDIVNSTMLTSPWTQAMVESLSKFGTPWIGTLDDPAAELAARGWQATLTQPGEAGANYGRWTYPVIPQNLPNMPRYWWVTAQKNG